MNLHAANAALPRFASVETLIAALKPIEPVYVLLPERFHLAARRFIDSFPGDTLYSVSTILETTASKSKNDRGVIYVETRGLNQRGEEVMILRRRVLIPRRPV